jgi:hypothetical protein
MLVFLVAVLRYLGATQVHIDFMEESDPTNEEEFAKIRYDCEKRITWNEYLEGLENYKKYRFLKEIREKRNHLLKNSDWIMTVDSFETLQNKEEWKDYRKQLRDLPSTNIQLVFENGRPVIDNSIFPIQPQVIRQ